MPEPPRPFRIEPYEIGTSLDGRPLRLAPMDAGAAELLGPQVAAIGPWAHYGIGATRMAAGFASTGNGAVRYQIQCGSDPAGAVVICNPWLAGPYLQLLAVLPAYQKRGIGAQVLTWIEEEARGHFRNLWLCVSAFNTDAQRFYRARGFELVTTLEGLLRDGDDELLMRKRLVTSAA
jgi:ribosomal protein S18 acetylase RimI-like enzyme